MPIPPNVIINADDFGYNESKNQAILECFLSGKINSASIMTNMAYSQQAIELSKKYGFSDNIGLHVCLTEGSALTDLSGTAFVDENGSFVKTKIYKTFIMSDRTIRELLKREVKAQLKALFVSDIIPTHINSHHHIHTLPWISPVFKEVAKEFNLKLRLAQTWNDNKNLLVPFYRYLLNRSYKRRKINFSDYFETVKTAKGKLNSVDKSKLMEIMVHPDLNDYNELYDCIDRVFM